jgi:hypothetical protein
MKAEWDTLSTQWLSGDRTREAALHLLFLSWYSCIEPPHLTGLEDDVAPQGLVDELFEFLGGEDSRDVEFMFVVAIMAEVAPWCLGDVLHWEAVAERFRARLGDNVLRPEVFSGRGGYGEYFAHQALTQSGGAT